MLSQYGQKLLGDKLVTLAEARAMPLGVLSWLASEQGITLLKSGKMTLDGIKARPAACIEALAEQSTGNHYAPQI